MPAFDEGANWIVSDVTNSIYGKDSNPGGTVAGLLAEIRQIPGRLYLDLADTKNFTDIRDFLEAYDANANTGLPWYRYGYKDDANASPKPVLATQADMRSAVAFQQRKSVLLLNVLVPFFEKLPNVASYSGLLFSQERSVLTVPSLLYILS